MKEISSVKKLAASKPAVEAPEHMQMIKNEVLNDIRNQLKREGGKVLPEMQAFKSQFDGQLRSHFEQLNEQIKSVEDTIQDIRRNKHKTLENMKKELSTQMTNTQDALVEDNSSLKVQLEQFFKEHQQKGLHHAVNQKHSPNSPGSSTLSTI